MQVKHAFVCTLLAGLAVIFLSCHHSQRIVFLGDSITEEGNRPGGYVDLIRTTLQNEAPDDPPVVIGAGVSGNKVPDLQARLQNDVLARHPTLVVIYIGINDVWHHTMPQGGTTKERYEAGLRDIITRLKNAGAGVILCTPSVIGEKTDGSNPLDGMLEEYAAISRRVAQSMDTPVCDLRTAFLDALKRANPQDKESGILTRDGVHLTAAGNRFVADQILASLRGEL